MATGMLDYSTLKQSAIDRRNMSCVDEVYYLVLVLVEFCLTINLISMLIKELHLRDDSDKERK